ncbi:tetratricopeptide repeat protein [Pseudoalteromonas sp. SMS1]|uniref:tetratricopeptide repeat protein n=1 Tax=Pseudoalteromonas sp. SMS1 TaxID=2908894 RepID=UPI001F1B9E00|nr:tetratricopeptide repeat protein [Pseudoalteromonas sp. SMS1]MCF2857822.1 tetratricopeptide repeat protein [Pseudoalteromonas sp. SMS1]
MENKITLTPENIQQVLASSSAEHLVLLSFYSTQHPDCVAQAAILDELATQYSSSITIATLDCDLQQALAGQLAQQVGLQALPTVVVLKGGAPVDVLAGPKSKEEITQVLTEHLPSPELILLEQAKQALVNGDLNSAYSHAKQAYDVAKGNPRVNLVFADICIQIQKIDDAEALLSTIPEDQQDAYFNNLQTKLSQAKEAQDSPEVKRLTQAVAEAPEDLALMCQLAQAQVEAGKKEDALASLFKVLSKDLSFGEAKKGFLDIIASLPEGDGIAATYRRKLYSLLY